MPFIETYAVGGEPEAINHFGAVTLRVNGQGNLLMTMYSLDKVETVALLPFTMQTLTSKEPTRLSNFNSQRMIFRIETNEINDYMKINRILFWIKQLYSQYPGID